MLRSVRVLVLLLAAALPAAGELAFQADYAKAAREAREAGKGMVVEFETAWCPFCRAMEKVTFKDPKVMEQASRLVLARVDADTQKVLARKFRTTDAFPLFVFLDREGAEVFRLEGYQPPDSFARALEALADPESALVKAKRAAAGNAKDPAAQAALGDALYEVGATGEAADAYGTALGAGLAGEAAERAASRRAEHAREKELWSEAEALYAALLKDYPDSERNPYYHLGLVETYLAWGQDQKARTEATRLATEHPGHPACVHAAQRFVETPRDLGRNVTGEELYGMACAACHAPDRRLVGPSLGEIASTYAGDPDGIVAWIKAPGKRREDYPAMPAQDAAGEYLRAIAEYILGAAR